MAKSDTISSTALETAVEGEVRISAIEAHCLRLPYKGAVEFHSVKQTSAEYVLLVLKLDDGTEAIAEAVCRPEFSGEDARALAYVIETFFAPVLIGADPLDHQSLLGAVGRFKGCAAALALVDIALWDARGKIFGQPVWRLLGGGPACPVPLTWIAHGNDRKAQTEEACRIVDERGYKGMKLKTWKRSEEDVLLVRDVRKALGDDIIIYVDCNGSYSETEARTILTRVSDYGVSFIEDPCRLTDLDRQRDLANALPVAILGDAYCDSLNAVHRLIQARAIGGASVKLRRTGLTESLKIIALCQAAGIPAVIGTDSDSRIGAMARVHLRMAIPYFSPWPIETHFFDKLADDVFAGDFQFSDGQITPTDAPGFGASIDRAALEKYVF